MTITQEELKKLVSYDPDTGLFAWVDMKYKRKLIAGCLVEVAKNKLYIRIKINKKNYYAHRLAFLFMNGVFPNLEVDHIDGDGCNNR